MRNYTPKSANYSSAIPEVETTDTNHADNINAGPRKLAENDAYFKARMDGLGLVVSGGKLCVAYKG